MAAPPPTQYRIPLAQPDLCGNEILYVNQALMRRQLTQGAFVERFEAEFAAKLGVKHAIATSSGTAALHLALLAAGVQPGDRVLVPTLTYVATAAAVRYCGAVPVFADVDPATWGLAGDFIGEHDLVLPVHLYGVPCVVNPSDIEDAAEALGANLGPRPTPAGTYGRLGCFSFYGNKILTTGEGGMVVTDDATLAAEVRLLRGQGQDPRRRYWHIRVGLNGRMTELSAAIGCAQLERLDEMLSIRHQRLREYRDLLAGAVEWQTPRPGTVQAPWVAACLLPAGTDRDRVAGALREVGVETRPVFPLISAMPPYVEFAKGQHFPVARGISTRGLVLPLHSQLRAVDVEYVCAHLRRFL